MPNASAAQWLELLLVVVQRKAVVHLLEKSQSDSRGVECPLCSGSLNCVYSLVCLESVCDILLKQSTYVTNLTISHLS